MFGFLKYIIGSLIQHGRLTLVGPNGERHEFGDNSGSPVVVKLADSKTALKIATDPDLYVGEAYMDGTLTLEEGDIYDLMQLAADNTGLKEDRLIGLENLARFRNAITRFTQSNPIGKAKRNVAHHYDLDGRLYDLFLDQDRQYSCAYFIEPDMSLDQAQLAKKRHIAAKLQIKPGMKVLDIGCGWGGLGLYLAAVCGASVVGVTLSEEQHAVASKRARDQGLADKVDFRLLDYRELDETFDRIVSVGMFEHVGVRHFPEFFDKTRTLLKEDGIACIHSIGRSDGPGRTSSWITKYIFPGGYIPALSEVMPAVEAAGLIVTDVEVLRLHYAETLRQWRTRFANHRDEARKLYDERFCKMWEFYLAASESMFRCGALNNFQLQYSNNQKALPLTRNYMIENENHLKSLDGDRPRLVV